MRNKLISSTEYAPLFFPRVNEKNLLSPSTIIYCHRDREEVSRVFSPIWRRNVVTVLSCNTGLARIRGCGNKFTALPIGHGNKKEETNTGEEALLLTLKYLDCDLLILFLVCIYYFTGVFFYFKKKYFENVLTDIP